MDISPMSDKHTGHFSKPHFQTVVRVKNSPINSLSFFEGVTLISKQPSENKWKGQSVGAYTLTKPI